jgi:hypothetical protein
MKLKYAGEIKGGKLTIFKRQDFLECIDRIGELEVNIIIEQRKKKRSNNQNSYLWGVVYPIVRDCLKNQGWVLSLDEVHEFCKGKFNRKDIVDVDTGELLGSYGGSTSELDTFSFNEYFESIIRWVSEYFNTEIPYPNEQTTMDF